MSLADRWPLPDRTDLRDELLAAWDRDGYHDRLHLAEVLDRLDQLGSADFDPTTVALAAWFHDAVYDGADDDEERAARLTRWEQVHAGPLVPGILDCEDHQTRPLPDRQRLASLPAHTVPVLCRTGEPDADPDALFQVLSGGYGVVLWRRAPQRREPGCAGFHRGVHRTVAQAGRAGALPEELRRLRLEVTAGLPESYWSRDLALLYAEPEQAYADAGDLLEAL